MEKCDCGEILNEDGTCPYCDSLSPCCGVEMDSDSDLCPKCLEHT